MPSNSENEQCTKRPCANLHFRRSLYYFNNSQTNQLYLGNFICPCDWQVHVDWILQKGSLVYPSPSLESLLKYSNHISLRAPEPNLDNYPLTTFRAIQDVMSPLRVRDGTRVTFFWVVIRACRSRPVLSPPDHEGGSCVHKTSWYLTSHLTGIIAYYPLGLAAFPLILLMFIYDRLEYNLMKLEWCSTKDFQVIFIIVITSINKCRDFHISRGTCAHLWLKIDVIHAFNPDAQVDEAVGSISWRSVCTA